MNGLRVLVSVWFQVLFHRPHRAAFHLSLTVLVHYRCFEVFSLGRVVLPASSGPCVVRSTQEKHQRSINPAFAYRAITFCGKAFQLSSASRIFRPPPEHSNRSGKILSYNPSCDTLKRTERGLGSSLFARRYLGNKRLFSFPPGTEMFHFPGFALRLCVEVAVVHTTGLPHSEIAGSKVAQHLPDAYRSHAASFLAFETLGIHHTPLFPAPIREFFRQSADGPESFNLLILI